MLWRFTWDRQQTSGTNPEPPIVFAAAMSGEGPGQMLLGTIQESSRKVMNAKTKQKKFSSDTFQYLMQLLNQT